MGENKRKTRKKESMIALKKIVTVALIALLGRVAAADNISYGKDTTSFLRDTWGVPEPLGYLDYARKTALYLVMLPMHIAHYFAGYHRSEVDESDWFVSAKTETYHRDHLVQRVMKNEARGNDKWYFNLGVVANIAWVAIPCYWLYTRWSSASSIDYDTENRDGDDAARDLDVDENPSPWYRYLDWRFWIGIVLLICAAVGAIGFVLMNAETES